ncbi:MAG: GPW/gp25 family protein [Burkholderiales bacterium]|nr:GPW/gp25 family protein [Burkholderiales bacterium]MDE1926031.1 GPW/gp25 family protein [Burkholderiales bacterium]MDE2160315.1 GPW/gp25 family protein [Burkholderiales bacterium]MDE2505349.1 GPW/gp25 family protein [Burkholderiales bacterium]
MNIDWPFHLDARGRSAAADLDDHVRDLIEQLLFTNHGERVNRPDFGSGVQQLVFAPNSPELAATVQLTLQAALQQWLADLITVRELQVSADDARLTVDLAYIVKASGESRSATFTQPGV